MKTLTTLILTLLVSLGLWAEEVTLKCNYFTHSGNEKPLRDHSENFLIFSRCDEQKFDRNVQLLRQGQSTLFDDEICKTKKTKYISFDEINKIVKVQQGSNWITYKNKPRERICDTEYICRVKNQEVFIDEKKIHVVNQDRYTPKNCGWPSVSPKEFLENYQEYKDNMSEEDFEYLNTYCLGVFDLEGVMQSNEDIFIIDRKTGKYSETTKRGKTTLDKETDSLNSQMFRGAFTRELVLPTYQPEEGECSLVSIGKKF